MSHPFNGEYHEDKQLDGEYPLKKYLDASMTAPEAVLAWKNGLPKLGGVMEKQKHKPDLQERLEFALTRCQIYEEMNRELLEACKDLIKALNTIPNFSNTGTRHKHSYALLSYAENVVNKAEGR